MAAGRIDVSKRRGVYGYSKRDFDDYRNGVHAAGLNWGGVDNNRHNTGSTVPKLNYRNGFSCRDDDFLGGNGHGTSRVGYGQLHKHEDGVQLPPEKKRKCFPIIWDKEDKGVSISSKNRVTSRSTTLPVPPPPARGCHQESDVTFDGGVAVDAFLAFPVVRPEFVLDKDCIAQCSVDGVGSKSPATSPPPSFQEEHQTNDRGQGQEKEEDIAEVRKLSMSRWASDGDSPIDALLHDHEDMPRETAYRMESTPESGEFLEEVSDREQSSGFYERDHKVESNGRHEDFVNNLENDDVMEVDRIESNEDFGDSKEPIATTQRSVNMLNSCRSVFEFEKLNEINEGTYGKVYRARDKKTGEIVALKKVKMDVGSDKNLEEWGFPLTSLREINILLSFRHPSIVNVKEVVMDDLNGVYIVMEYMEHDLKGLMQMMKQPFSTSEVKCLMLQLLEGVKCLHDNWVLHRDLKTLNLLVNNQGDLKLCDFGMARQYGSPSKPYTSLVVTLWYRAPELLLGAKEYSTAVDMWSVGCIMAELLAKEPLFKGNSVIDQLKEIFRTLGTPNEMIWPGLSKLKGAKPNFHVELDKPLRNRFPATFFTGSPVLSDLGFDLLNSLLTFDPEKRITVGAALNHAWFQEVPLPKSKEFMPMFPPQLRSKRTMQRKMKSISPWRCSVGKQDDEVLADTLMIACSKRNTLLHLICWERDN